MLRRLVPASNAVLPSGYPRNSYYLHVAVAVTNVLYVRIKGHDKTQHSDFMDANDVKTHPQRNSDWSSQFDVKLFDVFVCVVCENTRASERACVRACLHLCVYPFKITCAKSSLASSASVREFC